MQGFELNDSQGSVSTAIRPLEGRVAEGLLARAIAKLDEAHGYFHLWHIYQRVFYLSNALSALAQAQQRMHALADEHHDEAEWRFWQEEIHTTRASVMEAAQMVLA